MENSGVSVLVIANLALGTAVAICFVTVLGQASLEAGQRILKRVYRCLGNPTFQRRSRWT